MAIPTLPLPRQITERGQRPKSPLQRVVMFIEVLQTRDMPHPM